MSEGRGRGETRRRTVLHLLTGSSEGAKREFKVLTRERKIVEVSIERVL